MHHGHAETSAARERSRRRLYVVLLLSAGYMLAEAIGGWLTGSLALLADAGHMLSDVASLALTLFVLWIAQRPPNDRRTYGHTRAEILGALAQGAALVGVALLIVIEAVERLADPPLVHGPGMLAIASGGLLVNLAGLWILSPGRHELLSVRGAWLHVLSDALGSVAAIGAGIAIWAFGWRWADPAASLGIAALVVAAAWSLLREATDVLMETAPRHLDVAEIRGALCDDLEVLDVHDLHVWSIGSGEVSLSCHVTAAERASASELLARIYRCLGASFGIDHATIQIEPVSFADQSPRSVCGACDGLESAGSAPD